LECSDLSELFDAASNRRKSYLTQVLSRQVGSYQSGVKPPHSKSYHLLLNTLPANVS
jgi:hypothetical protein